MLLHELAKLGLSASAEGVALRLYPASQITAKIRQFVADNKAALLDELRSRRTSCRECQFMSWSLSSAPGYCAERYVRSRTAGVEHHHLDALPADLGASCRLFSPVHW